MKILTPSLVLALAASAQADIITLKDGTKLDAEILSRTLEEYELEVSVTSSIKERRTIKRSEVADIERVNESDTIFEEKIAGLAPAPPYTATEDYEARIQKIEAFLVAHKLTAAGSKAKRMLRELKEEYEFIKAGGIKTSMDESGLIDAEKRQANALEIDSQSEAAKFKKLVDERSFLPALRQYDVLESDYFGSLAQRDSMELMSRLASSYGTLLERELSNLETKELRREEAFNRLSAGEQARMLQADEQRKAAFDRLWTKEEEEGQSWFTVDTENASSLEGAIDSLMKEADRISEISNELTGLPETGELFRKGWAAAGEKNQEELEAILDDMDEIGVPERYINQLVDRFDPTINNPPAEEDTAESEEAADEETETTE